MKYLFTFLLFSLYISAVGQIEINTSYTISKFEGADGLGINLAYEIPFQNKRLGIKPQLAYKCNCGYESFSAMDIKNKIVGFHNTVFYKLVNNPKYQLIPNIGINMRYSYWSAQMHPPLDERPIRIFSSGIRDENFYVSSTNGNDFTELEFFTPGFSIQMQNRFQISEKVSMNVAPFIEFDYDRYQSTGGGYFGITYDRK